MMFSVFQMLFQYSILVTIPTNKTSSECSVFGHSETEVLSDHYFVDQNERKAVFFEEWESFKFDLFSLRKK